MADQQLEEIRQQISDVWGKQPCWPNEETCVLHVVTPYLLQRLEAETKRREAAEAVVKLAEQQIYTWPLKEAIEAWQQVKAEAKRGE